MAVTHSHSWLTHAAPTVPANMMPAAAGVKLSTIITAPATVIITEPVADIRLNNDSDLDNLPELLSALLSSSNSSSKLVLSISSSRFTMMTAISSIAKYQQSAPMKPPTLSASEVTPKQLQKWELSCQQYFFHKDVEANNQVKCVAWGLLDLWIQQWYSIDSGHLNTLDFAEFMVELCSYWLPSDWASDLCLKMLSS